MLLKSLFQEALEKLKINLEVGEARARLNILLEDYFQIKRTQMIAQPDYALSPDQLAQWQEAIQRLINGEPVQYICGKTFFYGQEFKVNPAVLIPRSETEELVGFAVKKLGKDFRGNILDIGTGSGCIAVSVAKACPKAQVFALDFSQDALEVAQENAALSQVGVEFRQLDFLDENSWNDLPEINALLSNPPYVTYDEWKGLENEVKAYEPALALHPPVDLSALVFYEKIEKFASQKLKPNGFLLLEINENLSDKVLELFMSKAFKAQKILKDLNGKDRFFYAERKSL